MTLRNTLAQFLEWGIVSTSVPVFLTVVKSMSCLGFSLLEALKYINKIDAIAICEAQMDSSFNPLSNTVNFDKVVPSSYEVVKKNYPDDNKRGVLVCFIKISCHLNRGET